MPSPAPFFDRMPTAPVSSTHLEGLMVNALLPASAKRGSNSTPLNAGLFSCSHSPRYSSVFFSRIQFFTTSLGSAGFFWRAMSVMQI